MQEKETQPKEIQPIPADVLSWLEVKGFIELYIEKLQDSITCKEAYEKAEGDFYKAYSRRRYIDYVSFMQSKWRYANRILRNNKNKQKTQETK